VRNEAIKVSEMSMDEIAKHVLVLKNLTKYYGDFVAVKGSNVLVDHASCFGLLGKK
jgi:hypothetical protein